MWIDQLFGLGLLISLSLIFSISELGMLTKVIL